MNTINYTILMDDLRILDRIADSNEKYNTLYRLQVGKAYNGMPHLEIGYGDAATNTGWLKQCLARKYTNLTGAAGASREEIISYIKQMLEKTSSFLQNPSMGFEFSDPVQIASISHDRLNALKIAFENSQKGIDYLKKIYTDKRSQEDLGEIDKRIREFIQIYFRIALEKLEDELKTIEREIDKEIEASKENLLMQQNLFFIIDDLNP